MSKRKRTPYPTEIAGYAGFDMSGNLAWGTIRQRKEDCEAEIQRTNPAVDGFPAPLRALPVYIGLDLNTQLHMELEA